MAQVARICRYRNRHFTQGRDFLFWAAFILTRPLGATIANSLDKPVAQGGLAISDLSATAALAVVMIIRRGTLESRLMGLRAGAVFQDHYCWRRSGSEAGWRGRGEHLSYFAKT